MTVLPDPKPAARVVDPGAVRVALLADRECVVCGRPATNAHHAVPKGSPWHGDDVPENGLPLCGTGTTGCHGAEHGSPYVDAAGRRWETDEVKRAIGRAILSRPATFAYVRGRLGPTGARRLLSTHYRLPWAETEGVDR